MSLLILNKQELMFIKTGLEYRRVHIEDLLHQPVRKDIIDNCKNEAREIDNIVSKINNILDDKWYRECVDFKIEEDPEEKNSNCITAYMDLNTDEAMKKLNDMKELMLEINSIKIPEGIISIQEYKEVALNDIIKEKVQLYINKSLDELVRRNK